MLHNLKLEPYFCASEDGFHSFVFDDWATSSLLRDYFHLRKQVFVDQLGWPLKVGPDGEFDQYDRDGAHYLLSQENGQLTGGMRLAPTTTTFMHDGVPHSYMIRDALAGQLESIPDDLITVVPPVDPDIWEMTRVISPKEPRHFKALMEQSCDFLRTKGAKYYLFQTRPVVLRMGRIWGFDIRALGPEQEIGGLNYQVFLVAVDKLKRKPRPDQQAIAEAQANLPRPPSPETVLPQPR